MIKKPVTIKKNMAMEDRPVAHLVQEASQYASQVYIEMEDKKINAMMSLSLQEGEDITVVAEGKDEKEAVAGVEGFLTTRK